MVPDDGVVPDDPLNNNVAVPPVRLKSVVVEPLEKSQGCDPGSSKAGHGERPDAAAAS